MITLYVNHYCPDDDRRRAELTDALYRNCAVSCIDRIVLLAQSSPTERDVQHSKIIWHDIDCSQNPYHRPTYRNYFDLVNLYTTSPLDINIIANSDIAFDHTLERLATRNLEGVCVALTRWVAHTDKPAQVDGWDNSQDAWIFQGRIKPVCDCDYPLGIYGCDNRIAWQLRHADYWVVNPCFDIQCWHLHASGIRWNGSCLTGNTAVVKRCHLASLNLPERTPPATGCISFSLWGNAPQFTTGALENARIARHLYPGWTVRYYVDDSVSQEVISQLRYLKCEIVLMPRNVGVTGMFWRFLVADDPGYERWIVRDLDSRLNYRERLAVDEWMRSGAPFHIMRDHPWQSRHIPAGMFGGIRGSLPSITTDIDQWPHKQHYGDDQDFLRDIILPRVKDSALIHDSCSPAPNGNIKHFPSIYGPSYRFVGERIFEDEHHVAEDKEALIDFVLSEKHQI